MHNISKTFLFTLFLSFCTLCHAQYQLTNPSFEDWEGTGLTDKPNGWSSFPQSDGTWASLASTPQHYHRYGGRPGHTGNSYLTIYCRSIIGVKANGNMTTGRIHAGSMSATNSANYNYTQRSSSYNHPFSGHPDSMYVWVSFYAASASTQGAIKAYIHGDSDFKDPNDTTDHSTFCAKASTQFTRTTSSSTTPSWVLMQIPFKYIGTTTANYVLMSMTTNTTPGGGSAHDSLSVDDIEFVYSAWLDNLTLNGEPLADFARATTAYTDTLESLDDVMNATVGYATQSPYATVSMEENWIDGTTRQVVLHVTAEDTTTMRQYTLTLHAPEVQPCDTVSDLNAIVEDTLTIVSWTPGEGNIRWEVEYGPAGFLHEAGTLVEAHDTTITLNGLGHSTTYDLYVRALCNDSTYTDWSAPVSFTTPAPRDTTAIDAVTSESWSIYPNPANDKVVITAETPILDITLTNAIGQQVLHTTPAGDCETMVETHSLAPGTYLVSIRTQRGTSTKKVAVAR